MCGIAAIFNIKSDVSALRPKALAMSKKYATAVLTGAASIAARSAILAHERLSIVDPESGGQPLFSPDRKQILAVNGEIYNHRDIRQRYEANTTLPQGLTAR